MRYILARQKANELKTSADDRLIAGAPSTVYQKRLGHRQLTSADIQQLIGALGTDEEKQALTDFARAQERLSQRLKLISHTGLVLEQAQVPYFQYYKRLDQPDLWKPEQMMAIIDVLTRLRV